MYYFFRLFNRAREDGFCSVYFKWENCTFFILIVQRREKNIENNVKVIIAVKFPTSHRMYIYIYILIFISKSSIFCLFMISRLPLLSYPYSEFRFGFWGNFYTEYSVLDIFCTLLSEAQTQSLNTAKFNRKHAFDSIQRLFWAAHWLQITWKSAWLFMVRKYRSVNFFRIFWANLCLGKKQKRKNLFLRLESAYYLQKFWKKS